VEPSPHLREQRQHLTGRQPWVALDREGWDRFRTALAHAREAYAIDDATAAALLAEGYQADDRGRGLEPPRTLVWITAERAAALVAPRSIELRLDAQLLAARWLAVVPFEGPTGRPGA
jgi:MoxR-like ATPase